MFFDILSTYGASEPDLSTEEALSVVDSYYSSTSKTSTVGSTSLADQSADTRRPQQAKDGPQDGKPAQPGAPEPNTNAPAGPIDPWFPWSNAAADFVSKAPKPLALASLHINLPLR
jgi:hypothetical protein